DGEDVRGEDDERVARHREDRGDRIDREDDVGELDDHDREEERVAPEERNPASEADEAGLLALGGPLLARDEDVEAGGWEERAEGVRRPVEGVEELAAGEDERRPEHERAEDAPGEHAVLALERHAKRREDHDEDEDVVDRERLLDEVAGGELERRLVAGAE